MVRSGQVVKVKVMEVDVERQRIGLSLRLDDEPGQPAPKRRNGNDGGGRSDGKNPRRTSARRGGRSDRGSGSMADALKKAGF